MAIKIGANLAYNGKLPNFERDSFETKAAMKAFDENSIDEGHLSYCDEDGNVYQYKSANTADATTGRWRLFKTEADVTLNGTSTNAIQNKAVFEALKAKADASALNNYVTTATANTIYAKKSDITNLADDEDIKSYENTLGTNVLKFADRDFNAVNYSGLGYKILRKNIIGNNNILSQDMVSDINTIYIVRYDFDLNGKTITIGANSILKFEGGSINNGTLTGNFITKYPKGTAIYYHCTVERVNINDFIKWINVPTARVNIDSALNTIINSFQNTYYRSSVDIEFSNGVMYTITKPATIPSKFNLVGINGTASIHIETDFTEPTKLIRIIDSAPYSSPIQYVKNIIFFNEARENVIVIALEKGGISFDNIMFAATTSKPFYRCIKSYGYCDRITLNKIITNYGRQSKDMPDIIHFDFGQGEGKIINQAGDGTTILLSNGQTIITGCINCNIIANSEKLEMQSCLGETGIIHIYNCIASLENCFYVNAALAQTYVMGIDDNNVYNLYFKNENSTIRYGKSVISLNNCQMFSQQFAMPPKDGVNYLGIYNPNNVDIKYLVNEYKETMFGGGGPATGLFVKYKQDDYFNIDIKNKIQFSLYSESNTSFYNGLNMYFTEFRPDIINPTTYEENRAGITYTYTFVVLIDEQRKIGYKTSSKSILATNNKKFIKVNVVNLKYHENCVLLIYRTDGVNNVLSKCILGKNDFYQDSSMGYYGNTGENDNLRGTGSGQVINNELVIDEINECVKAEKKGGNYVAYLNNLPQYGTWNFGDEVIIEGDGIYKYYGSWKKII